MGDNGPTTEFWIVRHGETLFNQQGRIQGQCDSPLSEKGRDQIKALAQRLKAGTYPDLIISSDLGRTKETTAIITSAINRPVVWDARWREVSFGVAEGLTWDQLAAQFPDIAERWRQHDWDVLVPGGESRRAVLRRLEDALLDHLKHYQGQRVMVVTHGAVLANLFCWVHNLVDRGKPAVKNLNGSLNIIVHGQQGWWMRTWGDTAHL